MHYKLDARSVGIVLLSLGVGRCLAELQRREAKGSREHYRERHWWSLVGPRHNENDKREWGEMVS